VDFTLTAALTFVPPVLCVASQAAHTVVMSQFSVVSQGSFCSKSGGYYCFWNEPEM